MTLSISYRFSFPLVPRTRFSTHWRSLTRTGLTLTYRLILTLTAGLSADPVFAGDVLIENIRGYSHTDLAPAGAAPISFTQLLIRDGKVLSIKPGVIQQLVQPETQRIDGQGKTLLPGLIDAHGHLTNLGELLASVDLSTSTSAQVAAEQVKRYAALPANQKSPWIVGRGWNQENWPDKQFPHARLLDAVSPTKPILMERIDGHAIWVNSKALALAEIDQDTANPEGGQIVRDQEGRATGILIDNAMSLVYQKIPATTQKELAHQIDLAFNHLLSLGITGVHDAGIGQPMIDLLTARAAASTLPLRVNAMLDGSSDQLPRWLKAGPISDEQGFLLIDSVKLYADGALGSRGAALLADYSDAPGNKGLDLTSPDELLRLYKLIDSHQFQICVHAIGDRGNQQVLNAFDELFKTGGNAELRHRIEHAQIIAPQDLARLKALDIIASMQPTHATSDMHMAQDRLGSDRLQGAYAWRTLLNNGTRMAFGSDFPVESANPFFGVHAAVTRQDHNNQPVSGWRAEEAVTVSEAISLFTRDAAWAGRMESSVGTLEPGKWADFILVDQNPYSIKPEQLWHVKVLETWVAGERRWPSAIHQK